MALPADGVSYRKVSLPTGGADEQFSLALEKAKLTQRAQPSGHPTTTQVKYAPDGGSSYAPGPRASAPTSPGVPDSYIPTNKSLGTDGDDHIVVYQIDDGVYQIVNEDSTDTSPYVYIARPGEPIVIDGGGGNDTIKVSTFTYTAPMTGQTVTSKPVDVDMVVTGGAGNDQIRTGSGNDYIDGGDGDDQISSGDGDDVAYGLMGNDLILGGGGADYIDGGRDDDDVRGDGGNDIVIGGTHNDRIDGGGGADTLITVTGSDTVIDHGNDGGHIFAKAGDTLDVTSHAKVQTVEPWDTERGRSPLGTSVLVEGSDAFKARMQSDLDMLSFMPRGQMLLSDLDASGKTTSIQETDRDDYSRQYVGAFPEGGDGLTTPADVRIVTNPVDSWRSAPPSLGLYNLMARSEDMVYGRMPGNKSPNPGGSENPYGVDSHDRDVLGLPYDKDGDGVNDPNTRQTTENGLRSDFGLPTLSYA